MERDDNRWKDTWREVDKYIEREQKREKDP